MPRLRIKIKDKFHDVAVVGPIFVIGRAESCDHKILSGYISRRHCEIRQAGSGWSLVELDSKMGTWLNGRQVHGAVPLAPGDRIKFANRIEAVFLADQAQGDTETLVAQKKRIQRDTERVVGLNGPLAGSDFSLHRNLTQLGRAGDNHIVIPIDTVSSHHAEITREEAGLVLRDLDSGNGTFINEQRIKQHVLRAGDVFTLDWVSFRYEENHFRMAADGTRIRELEPAAEASQLKTLPMPQAAVPEVAPSPTPLPAPPPRPPDGRDPIDRTLFQEAPPVRIRPQPPVKKTDWFSLLALLLLALAGSASAWYFLRRLL